MNFGACLLSSGLVAMKEISFLKDNHEKWQRFEEMLKTTGERNPDALADLFIQITDDLSYARTFYPGSGTEKYLNSLAVRIHQEIYKNKKERRSRIVSFWKYDLPETIYKNRVNLLWSFVIFVCAFFIGLISSAKDQTFMRLILGDGYVDFTLQNIENGDPTAIYKSPGQVDMFATIAWNNIKVAFMCIAAGAFTFFGTSALLVSNGIMLGAFMYIFYQAGVTSEALHAIWIHGTIEISIIIVAGAGGLTLARSIYSPGPYPLGHSVMNGARDAMKIGFGLVPLFLVAAFFEGFVTRMTEMNDYGREAIIFGSLAFIIWYFVIYPFYVRRRAGSNVETKIAIGGILTVVPGIALLMNFIVKHPVDLWTMLFFYMLMAGGIILIIYSIANRKIVDQEEEIERKAVQLDELLGEAKVTKVNSGQ